MTSHRVGFVYVLSNGATPGIVKVGMTTKLVEDHAKQLQKTGVPLPFDAEFRCATYNPRAVEAEAHPRQEPSIDADLRRLTPHRAIELDYDPVRRNTTSGTGESRGEPIGEPPWSDSLGPAATPLDVFAGERLPDRLPSTSID